MLLQPEIHPYAKFWLDVVDKAIKVVVVVVGGVWTYFLYQRSHPDQSKPEVEAEGVLFKKKDKTYLSICCIGKNLGQSNYWIERQGTVCEVWFLPREEGVPPDQYRAVDVFRVHTQMEPGATIRESLVLSAPDDQKLEKLRGLEIRLRFRVSRNVNFLRALLRRKLVEEVLLTDPRKIFGKDSEEIFTVILVNVLLIYLESVFGRSLRSVAKKLLKALEMNREDSMTIFMTVFRQVFGDDFRKVCLKYLGGGFPSQNNDEIFATIFLEVLLSDLRERGKDLWKNCPQRIKEETFPKQFVDKLLEEGDRKGLEMILTNIFEEVFEKKFDEELRKRFEKAAYVDLEGVVRKSFEKVFGEGLDKASGSNFEKVFSDNFEQIFSLGFEKVKVLGSVHWKIFGKFYAWVCGEVKYTVYPTNYIVKLPEKSVAQGSPMLGSFMQEESNVRTTTAMAAATTATRAATTRRGN